MRHDPPGRLLDLVGAIFGARRDMLVEQGPLEGRHSFVEVLALVGPMHFVATELYIAEMVGPRCSDRLVMQRAAAWADEPLQNAEPWFLMPFQELLKLSC